MCVCVCVCVCVANLLKRKGFSPEENVVHHLAAGACVEDAVERDLAVVSLLGLQIAGLQDPQGEVGVDATHVIPVGSLAICQAGDRMELTPNQHRV